MSAATAQPGKLRAWWLASRPRTFTATYAPLGLAAVTALEDGVFRPVIFALALLGTLLLQAGANLVNEYADYRRGADALKEAGQGMTIKRSVLTPREVLIGAVATVAGGSLIGLFLLAQSGPLLWWIGIGGVLVVILYTAGPFPLAYNGLGELAVMIFMGPAIVVGGYYVMAAEANWRLVWVSIPIALTVAAILHANNIRDMDADRAANKRTLALVLGLRAARVEYWLLVGGAYVALLALVVLRLIPWLALVAFISLPEALRLIRIVNTETETEVLHMAQGRTARLHGQFGLLIVAGWLVALGLRLVLPAGWV